MPGQSLSNTRNFSIRPLIDFLHSGTLDCASALYLGAMLKGKIMKKYKVKSMVLQRLQMEHLGTAGEVKPEGRVLPSST